MSDEKEAPKVPIVTAVPPRLVHATRAGKVTFAGMTLGGRCVDVELIEPIQHPSKEEDGEGLLQTHAHYADLKTIAVKVGDDILEGAVIGERR